MTDKELLQKIKDEVVDQYGYKSWNDFHEQSSETGYHLLTGEIMDEVCARYAESLQKEKDSIEIYVSNDMPENVYCAFTDEQRAKVDCDEAGVTYTKVELHFGPRRPPFDVTP